MSGVRIRVVDTETTGVDDDAQVVELGFSDVVVDGGKAVASNHHWSSLCAFNGQMPYGARAIHHISKEDTLDAPEFEVMERRLCQGADIFAAHHMEFDERFLPGINGRPKICTLKAARRIFLKAESHGNQALRYMLGLDVDATAADPPHRAGPDAYVTAHLLAHMLNNGSTIEKLVEWTEKPSLLPTCTFTKHRGKTWEEVVRTDEGYCNWCLFKAAEMDEAVKYTIRYWRKVIESRG